MFPDVITSYNMFTTVAFSGETLFWIIEYHPTEIGQNWLTSPNRYSLLRNECLAHPQDFKDRLNEGKYRIWTTTPYEMPW